MGLSTNERRRRRRRDSLLIACFYTLVLILPSNRLECAVVQKITRVCVCRERGIHEQERNQPRTNLYLLPNASVHFNIKKNGFSPDIYREQREVKDKRKFVMATKIIIQLILS